MDLSDPDFGTWLLDVFAHDVPPDDEDSPWYFQEDLDISVSQPLTLIRHFSRLCKEFPSIAGAFSLGQIDQGIWFLLGSKLEMGAHLVDDGISIDERLSCLHAMPDVYANFVTGITAEVPNCFDMWWDLLCDNFWGKVRDRVLGGPSDQELDRLTRILATQPSTDELVASFKPDPKREVDYRDLDSDERQIMDEMYGALVRILAVENEPCQLCALHGLGHLRHPAVPDVIDLYVEKHRATLSPDRIQWIQRCRDGTVL